MLIKHQSFDISQRKDSQKRNRSDNLYDAKKCPYLKFILIPGVIGFMLLCILVNVNFSSNFETYDNSTVGGVAGNATNRVNGAEFANETEIIISLPESYNESKQNVSIEMEIRIVENTNIQQETKEIHNKKETVKVLLTKSSKFVPNIAVELKSLDLNSKILKLNIANITNNSETSAVKQNENGNSKKLKIIPKTTNQVNKYNEAQDLYTFLKVGYMKLKYKPPDIDNKTIVDIFASDKVHEVGNANSEHNIIVTDLQLLSNLSTKYKTADNEDVTPKVVDGKFATDKSSNNFQQKSNEPLPSYQSPLEFGSTKSIFAHEPKVLNIFRIDKNKNFTGKSLKFYDTNDASLNGSAKRIVNASIIPGYTVKDKKLLSTQDFSNYIGKVKNSSKYIMANKNTLSSSDEKIKIGNARSDFNSLVGSEKQRWSFISLSTKDDNEAKSSTVFRISKKLNNFTDIKHEAKNHKPKFTNTKTFLDTSTIINVNKIGNSSNEASFPVVIKEQMDIRKSSSCVGNTNITTKNINKNNKLLTSNEENSLIGNADNKYITRLVNEKQKHHINQQYLAKVGKAKTSPTKTLNNFRVANYNEYKRQNTYKQNFNTKNANIEVRKILSQNNNLEKVKEIPQMVVNAIKNPTHINQRRTLEEKVINKTAESFDILRNKNLSRNAKTMNLQVVDETFDENKNKNENNLHETGTKFILKGNLKSDIIKRQPGNGNQAISVGTVGNARNLNAVKNWNTKFYGNMSQESSEKTIIAETGIEANGVNNSKNINPKPFSSIKNGKMNFNTNGQLNANQFLAQNSSEANDTAYVVGNARGLYPKLQNAFKKEEMTLISNVKVKAMISKESGKGIDPSNGQLNAKQFLAQNSSKANDTAYVVGNARGLYPKQQNAFKKGEMTFISNVKVKAKVSKESGKGIDPFAKDLIGNTFSYGGNTIPQMKHHRNPRQVESDTIQNFTSYAVVAAIKCTRFKENCTLICDTGGLSHIDQDLEDFYIQCYRRDIILELRNCIFLNGIMKSNLFVGDFTLQELQVINCNLSTIQEGAFTTNGAKTLQTLKFINNSLTSLTATSFNGPKQLKHFEISQHSIEGQILGNNFLTPIASTLTNIKIMQTLDSNGIVDPTLWLQGEDFPALYIVDLENNNLRGVLNGETFKYLTAVGTLNLQKCSLDTIDIQPFQPVLDTLYNLSLNNNYLLTLDPIFLDHLHMSQIILSAKGNTWQCDCDHSDMIDYIKYEKENQYINVEDYVCDSPEEWQQINMKDVDLKCDTDTTPPDTTEQTDTTPAQNTKETETTSTIDISTTTTTSTTLNTKPTDSSSEMSNSTTQTSDSTTETSNSTTETSDSTTLTPPTDTLDPTDSTDNNDSIDFTQLICRYENSSDLTFATSIKTQTADLYIRSLTSTSVIITSSIDLPSTYRIIYFLTYTQYSMVQHNSTTEWTIYNLKREQTYMFCLVQDNDDTVSPFDCWGHFMGNSATDKWLLSTDKDWFIGVMVTVDLLFFLMGVASIYFVLRQRPSWVLAASERVLKVNELSHKIVLLPKKSSMIRRVSSSSDRLLQQIKRTTYLSPKPERDRNSNMVSTIYTSLHKPPTEFAPTLPNIVKGNSYSSLGKPSQVDVRRNNNFRPQRWSVDEEDDHGYQTIDHYEEIKF